MLQQRELQQDHRHLNNTKLTRNLNDNINCKQIITMRKFNHKVILKYAGQALIIGTVTFILSSLVAVVLHMVQHGAPTSFGIYG